MKNNKSNTKTKRTDLPFYLFHQGTNYNAYETLGAHFKRQNGKNGVVFRVWAPNANSVSVVGDFNDWNEKTSVMTRVTDNGIYELFVENLKEGDLYKFAINNNGRTVLKADPYAFYSQTPPETASKLYKLSGYRWKDEEFLKNKIKPYNKPMNIYEVNLASWKKNDDGSYLTFSQLKEQLVDYVVDMGYTHVEFMPLSEYPFDGSWGYQVTGYYSITSRFGTPKEFMQLVVTFHQKGISVILDWVPAHFPKDEHGLYEFDGTACYENSCWARKEHKSWGTRIFDWGRNEIQSFLISNAIFLFEKFHIDGLRVDAVASMLYLDYDRKDGEWIPNENGGNYNLQAIAFLQKLNSAVFEKFPNALMIAEESTAFPLVTKPVDIGGLGFNFKWNMGWMNDVLSYMSCDSYFRAGNHEKMTFSMCYAFSENFVLPISHDEVVHGKKSLIDKMSGDIDTKFSSIRTFMMYMMAHPGKKLSFMGNEFGQFKEWNNEEGLEFFMLDYEKHAQLKDFNKTLNHLYLNTPSFYEIEDDWAGFEWITADEKENNVIAFSRSDRNGNKIFAIFNFSGNDYLGYRLGLDQGEYELLLSSDYNEFGGTGLLKKGKYKTVNKFAHLKDYSIMLDLPKFSGAYFIKKDKKIFRRKIYDKKEKVCGHASCRGTRK